MQTHLTATSASHNTAAEHLSRACALQTTKVEDLARLSFKKKPIYVGVDDSRETATREGLEQGYCVVPADKRFLLLFTFLKKNLGKKVSRHSTLALLYGVGWGADTQPNSKPYRI